MGFVDTNIIDSVVVERLTDRLYIRSYNENDYQNCFGLYSDPVITRFFDHGKPRTRNEIDAYIAERGDYFFKKGCPFGLFSVFLKGSGIFIGQVDAVPASAPGEIEIGWIFFKEFQNLGYCSEAILSFLIPFIKELSEQKFEIEGIPIRRIIATAHPENIPSQKMMHKAGLSFYKKGLRYGGHPRNWYELNLGTQNAD